MMEPQRFAPVPVSLPCSPLSRAPYRDAFMLPRTSGGLAAHDDAASDTDAPGAGGEESPTLEDTARQEREYLRERLRAELQREPGEEELNEWLRRHTEGY